MPRVKLDVTQGYLPWFTLNLIPYIPGINIGNAG